MNPEVRVDCPFCHQSFWTVVDWSGGLSQSLDIDCEVCCHALTLNIEYDEELEIATSSTDKAF